MGCGGSSLSNSRRTHAYQSSWEVSNAHSPGPSGADPHPRSVIPPGAVVHARASQVTRPPPPRVRHRLAQHRREQRRHVPRAVPRFVVQWRRHRRTARRAGWAGHAAPPHRRAIVSTEPPPCVAGQSNSRKSQVRQDAKEHQGERDLLFLPLRTWRLGGLGAFPLREERGTQHCTTASVYSRFSNFRVAAPKSAGWVGSDAQEPHAGEAQRRGSSGCTRQRPTRFP